ASAHFQGYHREALFDQPLLRRCDKPGATIRLPHARPLADRRHARGDRRGRSRPVRLSRRTGPVSRAAPRIVTIPPGVDFLATLAGQIIHGDLVPGLAYNPEDPLSLAGATVFVPTRRAARVLRSELTD